MSSFIYPPEVGVRYGQELHGFEDDVRRVLTTSFRPILARDSGKRAPLRDGAIPACPEEVAGNVAEIIAGFTRAGSDSAIRDKHVEAIHARILECVRRGIPMAARMLWSPKKHWVNDRESAVDLAELAALQTLLSVDAAVREVYAAGVAFQLDVEDIEFQFMEGQNAEIVVAREKYITSLRRLIEALGLCDVFTLDMVSDQASSAEELGRWQAQMEENHRVLVAYWQESQGRNATACQQLRTYQELHRLGWKGTIPPAMREYYLNRLGRVAHASDHEKIDMVLRNLAGILLHHQIGLMRGSDGIAPVVFSFVRSADAAPAELRFGRMDLRFVPRKVCSRVGAAAPWSTKGFVTAQGGKMRVSFRGWHELADTRSRFVEGWLTLAGQEGTAEVRADFRCEMGDVIQTAL